MLGALEMFSSNAKTRVNILKQSAYFDAEHFKVLCPKLVNFVRKRLFTSLSLCVESLNKKSNCAAASHLKATLTGALLNSYLPRFFKFFHGSESSQK